MVRQKVRYLIIQFYDLKCPSSVSAKFTAKDLKNVIRDNCEFNFGEISAALLFDRLQVKYFKPDSSTADPKPFAIIRVSREQADIVRATLSFMTNFKGVRCSIGILSVCGCPRTAKMALIRFLKQRHSLIFQKLEDDQIVSDPTQSFRDEVASILSCLD